MRTCFLRHENRRTCFLRHENRRTWVLKDWRTYNSPPYGGGVGGGAFISQ